MVVSLIGRLPDTAGDFDLYADQTYWGSSRESGQRAADWTQGDGLRPA
ncbi:hypothetical protein STVIR_7550 [Streptomyces viridochromogenes Tue57]|uniref:Uncharacterized protein n=1 Tax=Streptomyces viridochromogenes Tue57 TaxID=1160705 RepID=L8P8A2_STRVR|nr:hypothetical protein STVIR_7550 [Streptomyces viridochromogenes Tue57]